MLHGSTSAWEARCKRAFGYEDLNMEDPADVDDHDAAAEQALEHCDVADIGAFNARNSDTCISLAVKHHMCSSFCVFSNFLTRTLQSLVILSDSMTS